MNEENNRNWGNTGYLLGAVRPGLSDIGKDLARLRTLEEASSEKKDHRETFLLSPHPSCFPPPRPQPRASE